MYTCWNFYLQQCQSLHYFAFLFGVIGIIIFNIFDSLLKFSGKKYSLALKFVEVDTDPFRQAIPILICQNDVYEIRIRIQNTGSTVSM